MQLVSKPMCANDACGRILDGVEIMTNAPDKIIPRAGDISICAYCRTIQRFVGEPGSLTLVVATEEDLNELYPESRKVLQRLGRILEHYRPNREHESEEDFGWNQT